MLRNRLALGCWRLLENRCQCCWWRGCWCCRSCWRSSRRWWREGKQPGLVCSSWPKQFRKQFSDKTWSLMTMRLVLNIKVPFLPVQLSAFLRCTALAEVKHFSVWQMFLLWCTYWQLWLGRVCALKIMIKILCLRKAAFTPSILLRSRAFAAWWGKWCVRDLVIASTWNIARIAITLQYHNDCQFRFSTIWTHVLLLSLS